MMCRSISDKSILVSMQFFPNYLITMTTHISTGAVTRQLILKMNSEDQTVDHTNMFMGNVDDTIFVDFTEHTSQGDKTLKNVQRVMVLHRPRTRLVTCALSFVQTLTSKITRQHLLSGLVGVFQ
jgi:hypothetical protein